MSKQKKGKSTPKTYVIDDAPQTQGNYGRFSMKVNHFIKESPYYISCTDAFDKSDAIKITPYAAAYGAAQENEPIVYSDDPGFNDVIYGQQGQQRVSYVPQQEQAPVPAAPAKKAKPVVTRYFKKRAIPLLLILVLSIVALAVPLVSSLELIVDYVDIGEDIFAIAEIFEGDLVQHNAWDYPFEVFFNQEKARFVCKLKTGLTQYIDYERLVVVGDVF